MAFNLGAAPVFGSTPSTAAPTFGLGSSFSAPATKAGFGSGFTFGAPGSTTSMPSFNLGTSTTGSGFGFGGLTSAAPATSTAFGGFGSSFGTTTSALPASSTGFGVGTGLGGFGSAPQTTSTGFGGFGTQQPTTSSLFTGFGQTQPATTGFSGFGGFGAKPLGGGTTTSFGSLTFGSSGGLGTSAFGQPNQQLPAPVTAVQQADAVFNSVLNCNVFGDERDQVLSKWNLLQAMWGTGKGYYSPNAPPVEYTPQNPLCRFKAIGYSLKPTVEAKDCLVALIVNKKDQDIRAQESQLASSINTILGNRPNFQPAIETIKPVSNSKSLVLIYVQEKLQTGAVKRVSNVDVVNHFMQPMPKQQLTSMGVENIYAHSAPDEEQLKDYLNNPPAGLDYRLWKQAQLDNPDATRLLPVPIIGFSDVSWRSKCQQNETGVHLAMLDSIAEDIASLQRKHMTTVANVQEHKLKLQQLQHRLLKVLVKQEVTRNVGIALKPEEEVLCSQLEAIQTTISAPRFKGRLSELLSLMRMQRSERSTYDPDHYSMNPAVQDEIKQYLTMQQQGMRQLKEVVTEDLADLKVIKENLCSLLQTKP